MHDLGGELLCQLSERPVIKIRILGRSEMPECECRTAVFATGNNVTFKGDMVRRGLVCNLEAMIERPELREFKKDALDHAASQRGAYVAAALTIIRAYLAAGAPRVCGPFGSYAAWSRMVRSPLVWLGEPDPIASMDAAREEDQELSNIREYFDLWDELRASTSTWHTRVAASSRSPACAWPAAARLDLNPPDLRAVSAASGRRQERESFRRCVWGYGCARSAGGSLPDIGWSADVTIVHVATFRLRA